MVLTLAENFDATLRDGADAVDEAAERAAIAAVPERYRCNLDELAVVLDKSTNTLRAYMKQFPADFPMLSKGTHGRAYLFDSRAVVEFFKSLAARERAASAARDEEVKGLRLELLGGQTADDDAELLKLSPKDRVATLQAERLANELKLHRREHCIAADVEDAAVAWAAAIKVELLASAAAIADALDLDREARRVVEAEVAAALGRAADAGVKAMAAAGSVRIQGADDGAA